MNIIYIAVGIAIWVAAQAGIWYVLRGRYEIRALRRDRQIRSADNAVRRARELSAPTDHCEWCEGRVLAEDHQAPKSWDC